MTPRPTPPGHPQDPGGVTAPPVVIAAGGVIIPPHLCGPLWRMLRDHLAAHQRDGARVPPAVAQLGEVLRAAYLDHMSAKGLPAWTSADIAASSPQQVLITTGDLAARLRVSERHARRLAEREGIRPAARGLWHAEDAAALEVARRRR